MSENVLKELETFVHDNAFDIITNFDDVYEYLEEEAEAEFEGGYSSGHYEDEDEGDIYLLAHMAIRDGSSLVDLYQTAFEEYILNNFPHVDEICTLYKSDNIIRIMFSNMNLDSVIPESEVEEIVDAILG